MRLTRLLLLLIATACGQPAPPQEPETERPPQGLDPGWVVDLRPPEDFARRHLRGSINLQWGWGQFELRVQRLFPSKAGLRIVGSDDEEVRDAVAVARKRGFEAEGEVVDFAALPEEQVTALSTLDARELHRRRDEFLVLDARTAEEYAAGHIRAALFLYPDDIRKIAPALRADHPIAVVCEGGWRSSLVASWLRSRGFENVYNVPGGMAQWRAEDLPVEKGADQEGFR